MFANGSAVAVKTEEPCVQEGYALQEKGLHLALFIIADRGIALEILGNALNKLQAQRSREIKRRYWRSGHLKRKITRMVRNEHDTLQWLIYFEAEHYEREQERAGEPAERDMVLRYIKHLVQVTTFMSSFYVNVGINRLLRNYSTPEVRQVYESVTQHFPSDQEYRKVKADLMHKLKQRFGNFLRESTGQYGELRFETVENHGFWSEFVQQCLTEFTPWSTHQACQALARASYSLDSLPRALEGKTGSISPHDLIEVNRCHVLLHPTCYSRMIEALGLDPAGNRLAVPRFFINRANTGSNQSGCSHMAEQLTEHERRSIRARLSIESDRRNRAKPQLLRILLDGKESARLLNHGRNKSQCRIAQGATLLEIWTDYEGQDLLLATHWVEHTEDHRIAPAAATVALEEGRELLLEINPEVSVPGADDAILLLQCRPASIFQRAYISLTSGSLWLHSFPRYALLALLTLSIVWGISRFQTVRELSRQRAAIEHLRTELAQEKEARASLEKKLQNEHQPVQAYLLVPDESREIHVRGGDSGGVGAPEIVIPFSPHTVQVILELPAPENQQATYTAALKPFLENQEILVENFPKPANSPRKAPLQFVLPMSLVQAGKHYAIELNIISSTGHVERISTFTFYVH